MYPENDFVEVCLGYDYFRFIKEFIYITFSE